MLHAAGRLSTTNSGRRAVQKHPQPSDSEITVMASWEFLPDMGVTSKMGSDSDVDQLADDDDNEHPPKRRKTLSGFTSKQDRKRNPPTWTLDSHFNSNSFVEVQPGSSDGAIQLTDTLNTSFVNAASYANCQGSIEPSPVSNLQTPGHLSTDHVPVTHGSGIQFLPSSKSAKVPDPVHPIPRSVSLLSRGTKTTSRRSTRPLQRSGSLFVSTSDSSVATSVFRDSRRRLHRKAKATPAAIYKPSVDYRANQDEIELWSGATVAPVVSRKPAYSKEIEVDVRRMNSMKLMKAMDATEVNGAFSPTSITKPVAIPRISQTNLYETIIESLFGPGSLASPPLTIRLSPIRSRSVAGTSRASSSSDAQGINESSLSTANGEYHPDAIDLLSTSTITTTPSAQNSTVEASIHLPLQSSSVDAESIDNNTPPYIPLTVTENVDRCSSSRTSSTENPPPIQFNLRPDFENHLPASSTSIHTERLSPLATCPTTIFPSALKFSVTGNDSIPPANEMHVRPTADHESSRQHERNDLVLNHDYSEGDFQGAIELVSPITLEARNSYRRSSHSRYSLSTPPPSEVPPAISQSFDVLDASFSVDLTSHKMLVDHPEAKGTDGPQDGLSGLFTPITDDAPLPEIQSPALPTPQTELPSHNRPSSSETIPPPVFLNDGHFFEFSELATQSTIPTVFEPEHHRIRFEDLWGGRSCDLETRLITQAVIAEFSPDVEVWYGDEGNPVDGWVALEGMDLDEEETDELADDSDQDTVTISPSMARKTRRHAEKPRALYDPAKVGRRSKRAETQALTGFFESPDFQLEEEDDDYIPEDDRLLNPPMGLITYVARWTRALRCLLKGKRKLGDKDMRYLKDALKKVHGNRIHIKASSSLAKIVLAVANLGQEDVPDMDKLGLRLLARKSVRAWGIHRERDA